MSCATGYCDVSPLLYNRWPVDGDTLRDVVSEMTCCHPDHSVGIKTSHSTVE